MKKRIRLAITILLIILTLGALAYYISHHSYLLTQLSHTPPITIVILLLLYTLWLGAILLIFWASMVICKTKTTFKENFLINAYSVLFNFFIPGQGGIALRGVYLKKIKNLAVRNYIFISLVYFMFYAVISIIMLLLFNRPFWQTLIATMIIASGSYLLIYVYKRRSKTKSAQLMLTPRNLLYLFLATLLQSLIQIVIYAVELHSVNPDIVLRQVVTYTGAANFALFVALTPGAIGIRESFLLLTRKMHGISSANIISANIIDRAVFLVVLGLLFVLTLSLHAQYKNFLKIKASSIATSPDKQD